MKNREAIVERLDRYKEEKKKVTANRSWEAGYILGAIDALKWVVDNQTDA